MKKIILLTISGLLLTNLLFSQNIFLDVVYSGESVHIKESQRSINKLSFSLDSIYTNAAKLDKIPVYEGCENLYSKNARLNCMNNNIFETIYKNFIYPEEARLRGETGAVVVNYIIEKDGSVLPLSINISNEYFKEATLNALKGWLMEIKGFRASPAMLSNKPVRFSDFLIFPFKLDFDSKVVYKTQADFNEKDKFNATIVPIDDIKNQKSKKVIKKPQPRAEEVQNKIETEEKKETPVNNIEVEKQSTEIKNAVTTPIEKEVDKSTIKVEEAIKKVEVKDSPEKKKLDKKLEKLQKQKEKLEKQIKEAEELK